MDQDKINLNDYMSFIEKYNLTDTKEERAAYFIHSINSIERDYAVSLYKELGRDTSNNLYLLFHSKKQDIDEFTNMIEEGLKPFKQNIKQLNKNTEWSEYWFDIMKDWYLN